MVDANEVMPSLLHSFENSGVSCFAPKIIETPLPLA
jgi:hypothetical protein